ncbi:hypothetical protein [Photobacterium lutimaris]|uniref:Uncharacterized protein n=1 Tax=Photobacterium lutimaris TaxID=388278 RepID=A0A2T3IHQ1_9GAMM|nr:hypothetical protein [Photobacterium lutimaris]PSU27151.1 hypothetical protein C9I99_26705 [Photobacterium lutimaris]TDR69729.1 hypothetical protein DFP78_1322 [Photobacterium lutimaris]
MAEPNDIEQVTEVVKSIPEFVDAIGNIIQTPSGFIITTIVLLWLVLNRDFSKIFNLIERKETKRLEKLELYLSQESTADSSCLAVIKKQRNTYYFKVATRIYAEKTLRNSLISLHDRTSHNINWTTIRRAQPYLDLNSNNEVFVRDKTWNEKLGFYYNIFIAGMFSLIAVGCILLLVFSPVANFLNVVKLIGSAIALGVFALFILAQNFPVYAARKIAEEIKIEQSEQSEPIEA